MILNYLKVLFGVKTFFQIFFISTFLLSCVKDEPLKIDQPPIQLSGSQKVYVINEGPFQTGNGSISLFDKESGNVVENYYKSQNNSELGNIVQSLSCINYNYFIVVNNSNKIIICDNKFSKINQINNLVSPRYILKVSNQKAYVSDLYSNYISVIDLNSFTKIGSIPCFGKTEQMVLSYNKVFVTNTDFNYLYIINTINDRIEDSVYVGKNASSLIIDKNDKVWVLSSGNKQNHIARLTKINSITNQSELTLNFKDSDTPNNLCCNKTKDTLYFLNDKIYRFSILETNLPPLPFIENGNKLFYGIGINPHDYNIYVSDAIDYVQKSTIYVFDVNGKQKITFKAGIISNGFYFE